MTFDLGFSSIALWTMAVAITSSTSCALVGCYLVLRRMSMLGDAISHSVLPGIAIAVLLSGEIGGIYAIVGAMVFGLLTTILVQTLHSKGRLAEDSSMGVVFSTLFSIGVIIISREARQKHIDADCILYGLIEAVALDKVPFLGWEVPRTLVTTGSILAVVLLTIFLLWKEFKIVSFDAPLASAMGIPSGFIHYVLMALVAGVTVASFEAVGSILVIAMLIVPAATAYLLTDRLAWMMVLSVVVAVISSVVGYIAAAHLNTSVAGMMAVVAGTQFLLAVLFAPRHGLLSKIIRNAELGYRIVAEDVLARLYRLEEARREKYEYIPESGTAGASPLLRWWADFWLRRQHWIVGHGDGLALTEAGRMRAAEVVRSHRLWETYLDVNFELPADHRHAVAERVEHFIGPNLRKELVDELQDPRTNPEGRAIPPIPGDSQ